MSLNVDGKDIPDKNTPKKYLKALLVSIGIALIGTGVFFVYDDIDWNVPNINDLIKEDYQVGKYECEGWIAEGDFIINKYHPFDDIDLWEQKDRDRYVQLENSVLEYCIEEVAPVNANFEWNLQLQDRNRRKYILGLLHIENRYTD